MKIIECEQNTPEWLQARLARPTASAFGRILTPGGKLSAQADAYCHELLAEWLTGMPRGYEEGGGFTGNNHTDRGHALEAEARAWYELETGNTVTQVGFVTNDEGTIGCSPDGLVGDDGLVEIKCPAPWTHIGYLLGDTVPPTYRPQVQGQILVAERAWCDFVSYHPLMPPLLVRAERDIHYQDSLRTALAGFLEKLETKRATLISRGFTPQGETA